MTPYLLLQAEDFFSTSSASDWSPATAVRMPQLLTAATSRVVSAVCCFLSQSSLRLSQAAISDHESAMSNQDGFEELSQTLLQCTSQAEESISQLGARIDNKDTLLNQLDIISVRALLPPFLRPSVRPSLPPPSGAPRLIMWLI